MINKVSIADIKNNYVPNFSSNNNKPKNPHKKHLTTAIMTSLTASAAVAAGVLLAIKHKNNKELQKLGAALVERPKVFTQEMLDKIVDGFANVGTFDYSQQIMAMPLSTLKAEAKQDKMFAQMLKGMKMSENGFGIAIVDKNYQYDIEQMRYIDPECNTVLALVDALKNDCGYTCRFE